MKFVKILFSLLLISTHSYGTLSSGEKLFNEQRYSESAAFYQDKLKSSENENNPHLHYNLGTSLYKQSHWDEAEKEFTQALKTSDLGLQEKTYFNLGDTAYNQGQELQKKDPHETIKRWEESLKYFEQTLAINPNNENAKYNYGLLKKKLEELKKQEEQKKQEQKQEKKSKDNQQDQQKNGENKDKSSSSEPQENQKNQQNQQSQKEKQENSSQSKSGKTDTTSVPPQGQELGAMTKEEASQMLNEMKLSEKKLPLSLGGTENQKLKDNNKNRKDW